LSGHAADIKELKDSQRSTDAPVTGKSRAAAVAIGTGKLTTIAALAVAILKLVEAMGSTL
jgi:hypothetical protein